MKTSGWSIVYDGDESSPLFARVIEQYGLTLHPSHGWGSQDNSIKVLNIDGTINDMPYEWHVEVTVWKE